MFVSGSNPVLSQNQQAWSQAIVPLDAKISDCINSLNLAGVKIVMVVDQEGLFVGTISDGDIRRGLLRGLDLSSPLGSIIHREAVVVPPGLGNELVLQMMRVNKIQQIPVVDSHHKVVGLHLWDELVVPVARPNLMVIMAGGKGTRLRPHTENCPKPLLPVAGKPMLEHIIERAKLEGFSRFVLAVHYLGHMIEECFGQGERLGVHIDYLREPAPLGTAGALSLLHPFPDAPIVVSNGDVLTDIHYGELLAFHDHHGASATMAVRAHEWQHPFGVVHTEGMDIVGFEEKPVVRSHINAGVYVLSPRALEFLEPNAVCDMPTLFTQLQAAGLRTVAYPMHEPWLDVGRPEDLSTANRRY